MTPKFELG